MKHFLDLKIDQPCSEEARFWLKCCQLGHKKCVLVAKLQVQCPVITHLVVKDAVNAVKKRSGHSGWFLTATPTMTMVSINHSTVVLTILSATGRAKSYVVGSLSCGFGSLPSVKRYFDVGVGCRLARLSFRVHSFRFFSEKDPNQRP